MLRTGSMIVLSRLLLPRDFGLVAMATAVTGFLSLFRDFGLSSASVQRTGVTDDQVSTLFWINLLVGATLAASCVAIAPGLARFYGEPRLLQITLALGVGFLLNGSAVQHRALLQRRMQFGVLALIDTLSLILAIVLAVSMAIVGFGYWAVVAMAVSPYLGGAVGVWIAAKWIPGLPRRNSGVAPLLKFGGTLSLNSLVVNLAYNTDKILLGRFWGQRRSACTAVPTNSSTSPWTVSIPLISQVALPALARVQNDPERMRRHFLQGYGVFLAILSSGGCRVRPVRRGHRPGVPRLPMGCFRARVQAPRADDAGPRYYQPPVMANVGDRTNDEKSAHRPCYCANRHLGVLDRPAGGASGCGDRFLERHAVVGSACRAMGAPWYGVDWR